MPARRESDLVTAIAQNNIKGVEQLVEAGADVNEISANGFAPLCIAAFWGIDQLVRYLLKNGADVNIYNSGTKWTALHCAAFQGHAKCILHLIGADPQLDLKDNQGRTAADFASAQEKIWPFFASRGCKRASKQELIDRGIIQKADFKFEGEVDELGEAIVDPLHPASGKRMAHLGKQQRPGSAYVMRMQNPSENHRPGSRAGNRPAASGGGSSFRKGRMSTPGIVNRMANLEVAHSGDILGGFPSPVQEENEKASPSTATRNARNSVNLRNMFH